jgi:DNA (cytosine-5)-methyltransferase 1
MNKPLTLGSLFDGSGGFPLGAVLNGITPVWASEIEPFPIRVTTKRLPQMKHYGDISRINGAKIEPVDIITFGSPCTDMSVAGKRAGLTGTQSVLFYEAIRIVKEMRCATNGRYPRFILWENVPGAFSSNKGEDFKAVLEEIVQVVEPDAEVPSPEKNGWPYADILVGDGWSVAYRTVDAQYFGVAQRRRRIYLVADFGSERAGEILFEREGVSRNFAPRFPERQGTARNSANCTGTAVGRITCLNDQGGERLDLSENITLTLRAEAHHPSCVMQSSGFCTEHSSKSRGVGFEEERSPTLRAGVVPGVAIENYLADGRCRISDKGMVQTLTSRMGTGGMNVPLAMQAYGICSKDSNAMKSANPRSGIYEAETSRTLDANGGNPACNQGGIAVCVQGSIIGRSEENGPHGNGVNENVSFTLNTCDKHAVAYAMTTGCYSEVHEEKAATLMARDYKDMQIVNFPQYIVRRLTPIECARLQGFPDWWCDGLETPEPTDDEIAWWAEVFETHRKITGKSLKPKSRNQIVKWLRNPHSDSAEYKMWGNGVALPCVCFALAGIVWAESLENNP